jgi:uroporphyrinogen-III synthase
VIFTSRNAVDHFFRICSESKLEVPADMKYFCISEQTAHYLQKYIVVRKRKIFTGTKTAADMLELLRKHKNEKFLFPCSNIRRNDIPEFMDINSLNLTEAVLYETVASDLSDLADVNYDIIAFFSPSGITSLYANFPDFKQNKTRIAAFGPTTAKAVRDAGLILDIEAPLPNAPSMTGALEMYIRKANKITT